MKKYIYVYLKTDERGVNNVPQNFGQQDERPPPGKVPANYNTTRLDIIPQEQQDEPDNTTEIYFSTTPTTRPKPKKKNNNKRKMKERRPLTRLLESTNK